jgi:outer membrane protein assembly factor BamB
VYIGGASGDEVIVLDCTTGAKVAKIPVGSAVNDACCDTLHNKVYLATSAGKLVAVDGASDTVLAVTTIPSGVTDVCYDAPDDKVYCVGCPRLDGHSEA